MGKSPIAIGEFAMKLRVRFGLLADEIRAGD